MMKGFLNSCVSDASLPYMGEPELDLASFFEDSLSSHPRPNQRITTPLPVETILIT